MIAYLDPVVRQLMTLQLKVVGTGMVVFGVVQLVQLVRRVREGRRLRRETARLRQEIDRLQQEIEYLRIEQWMRQKGWK